MKEQPTPQQIEQKARKERILDRVLGIIMIAGAVAGIVAGFNAVHISMVWPILGLAGISLLVDSFLKTKKVKIILNVLIVIALVIVYFGVRSYNSSHQPTDQAGQNQSVEQINE